MRLPDDNYEYIKNVVIDNFEYYNIKSVPICASELALKIKIPIIPYSSLDIIRKNTCLNLSEDGFSLLNNEIWKIYYNDEFNCYGRIQHTIMHEIGHYLLGHNNVSEVNEIEAGFFAKYALSPPPLIHKLISQPTVENISEIFDVSYTAAKHALNYYNKWLMYGETDFTSYEKRLLRLFNVA